MKRIVWEIAIDTYENRMGILEKFDGFPEEDTSSQLEIIGILENLKQNHIKKLNTLKEFKIKNGNQ